MEEKEERKGEKEREKESPNWRRQDIHFFGGRGGVEREQGLSLKKTVYTGDRPGQQVITFPSLSYNKKVES